MRVRLDGGLHRDGLCRGLVLGLGLVLVLGLGLVLGLVLESRRVFAGAYLYWLATARETAFDPELGKVRG